MTSPTALYVVGVAVLTIVSAGDWTAVTVLVSVGEVPGVVPKNPWADATLVTLPASSSAWVIVKLAVQVIEAPGARLAVAGQLTVALSSLTVNGPARVTFPLLVTRGLSPW